MTTDSISPQTPMSEVLAAFPGARRALFRRYHLGGCSSCGFELSETLAQLCARSGPLDEGEVLAHIRASHEQDSQMEMAPRELAGRQQRGEAVKLLDIRTRDEWEATRLPGAEFVNQELVQSLLSHCPRDTWIVFYDHAGRQSLDAAAYFAGHGFPNAKFLRGGIDAWSQEVDPKIPRYRLEPT